ncbi:antichymotrypsin-2-like isoform X2 [Plodia interpunctella]|nr:antichymotrypsin-2-like isoform X2 [Plodia interpunctella]XP_053602771.1 antichymotrypsin-2-like isoform X2 [Plodia interpunctella]XP_053602773.1 antichymotrypsin-2-like isoform X2 [Plodia interpunctella]
MIRGKDTIEGNTVISPVAAALSLATLTFGCPTNESMQLELFHALGKQSENQVRRYVDAILLDLRRARGIELTVEVRAYIARGLILKKSFNWRLKNVFKAKLEYLDFKNRQAALLVSHINDWIKNKMKSNIVSLVQPSDVPEYPSLILVKAIRFRGFWTNHFKHLFPAMFHSPLGTTEVQMMRISAHFGYYEHKPLKVSMISMPFGNKTDSYFLILVPKDKGGLQNVLEALKNYPRYIQDGLKEMKTTFLTVAMPKFRIIMKNNLDTLFRKIGVKQVFETTSGMSNYLNETFHPPNLFVTGGFQENIIEVSETGTSVPGTGLPLHFDNGSFSILYYNINHPFIFYVIVRTRILLFGTFNNVQTELFLGKYNDTLL